ncbi:receptor-like protein 9DC3 [Lotus japonicus]|uniref:receptor-like protein 9DC3 n=1 Tax=Lotus japonicus TaxID=34305 RepID=UPI002582FCF1|nr:receptor-like protein 9DC3 [Lotus japonicus]
MGHLSLLFGIILCLLFEFPSFSFSSSHSSCLPDQSSALLQFKASFTIGASFAPLLFDVRETYAYLDKTATWENGTDCCSWLGVTCDRVSGHVIGLDLSCAGLEGKIHPNSTLFHLTHLQTLNLAFNDFYFSPLSSQFGSLVSLTHLNLSASHLEGEIPSQISHLSKLALLDLSSSHGLKWKETTWRRLVKNATSLRELVMDGTNMSSIRLLNMSSSLVTLSLSATGLRVNLASDIFCLPNLQHLYFSRNPVFQGQLPKLSCSSSSLSVLDLSACELQGSIPPSLSNLSHLTSLTLSHNNINGSIPSSLLTLPSLTSLDLSSNDLSGQIPDVFPKSNRFQELQLRENKIGGVLPLSLSNLHHLILLDLSFNKFSGQIPNVFGGLTKLKTLYLGYNNFRGQIPSSLFDLTQLSYLDCSSNKLEGPLPKKITGLSNLTVLNLNYNLLNETIPSWCLSLPSLERLGLKKNQFAGHISAISSYSLKYLYLSYNKLHGNIPDSIFNLMNLRGLGLSSNNLSGHLNFQLFSKLQHLYYLSLSENSQLSLNFKSEVNYSFSNLEVLELSSVSLLETHSLNFLSYSQNLLTSLRYLDLSFNQLEGDISTSICNASILEVLKLSHNKFTGSIPQCLGQLPYLEVLDLKMNKLHGTLPSNFSKENELRSLNFNGNQLEGPLPESLSHCTELEFLDLGNNQIEDTFPHWLQSLPNLEVLVLRDNKFHGLIVGTKTKHPFPSLMIFDISCNNLSGPIPKAYVENFKAMKNNIRDEEDGSVEYMKTLLNNVSAYFSDTVTVTLKENTITFMKIPTIFAHVDLSKNMFDGEIPDVIGQLHALKGLNLSYNRLIGPIPRSMGNLKNLESLDLSSNVLTGGIPTELTNMNSLEVLNLAYNHLVGEIPLGKQFNTFLNVSYEGNLGLCGFPLSKKCHVSPEQHSPPSPILLKEEKFGFGWKPVAIGYGCGMVFGIGLGCSAFSLGKPQWLVRMFGGQPNKKLKRRTKRRTHGTLNQLVQMS